MKNLPEGKLTSLVGKSSARARALPSEILRNNYPSVRTIFITRQTRSSYVTHPRIILFSALSCGGPSRSRERNSLGRGGTGQEASQLMASVA